MPLIRFRLGDTARWVSGTCPCGRTTPRLELLGRNDDMLIVANSNVEYAQVLAALTALPALSSSVQMIAGRIDRRDSLTIRIEAREDVSADEAESLQSAARDALQAGIGVLGTAVADGSLAALTVEVVGPGGLERNERTGKLIRLQDGRLHG
jgi:phenylacetate-CoA ligase